MSNLPDWTEPRRCSRCNADISEYAEGLTYCAVCDEGCAECGVGPGEPCTSDNEGNCQRCGDTVWFAFTADDGTPIYEGPDGNYTCADFHGHDEYGIYAPTHTLVIDEDESVVRDSSDGCYYDEDREEWVVVHSDL